MPTVGETVHCCALICLWPSASFHLLYEYFVILADNVKRVQPFRRVETVSKDNDIRLRAVVSVNLLNTLKAETLRTWYLTLIRHDIRARLRIRLTGSDGDRPWLHAFEWLCSQLNLRVLQTREPAGVENASFAANAVVWCQDFVVLLRGRLVYVVEQLLLYLEGRLS